jgi:hypothetical protein
MRLLRAVTLSFCPLLAFAQTADQDWRFAHPGATLVGSVHVAAMMQSPILNTAIDQATAKDPTVTAVTGMVRGMLSGISEVRFSVRDIGAGKDPDVLALVTGRLDDALATSLAQGKTTIHRVDANTILLGEGNSLAEAIQRLGGPATAQQNPAVLRGKALAGYDLWFAGALPALPMTAMLGDMLHGLALGMSMQDGLKVELAVDTASAQMADELIRKVREAQKEQPVTAGAALTAEVEGTTAHFRVSVERSVIEQAIQEAAAKGIGSQPGLFGPSAPVLAPPPKFKEKEPVRKTILIYGLDDGPREIDPAKAH